MPCFDINCTLGRQSRYGINGQPLGQKFRSCLYYLINNYIITKVTWRHCVSPLISVIYYHSNSGFYVILIVGTFGHGWIEFSDVYNLACLVNMKE